MSHPPYPPQSPAPVGAGRSPDAPPAQVGFLNQAPGARPPVPQGGPLAVGFPNYRSPAPSPPNRTGLIVGTVVVLTTVVFAVVGFLIVAGRGANSPEGAVTQFVQQMSERDAEGVYDLLCEPARRETSESELREALQFTPPGEVGVEINEVTDSTLGELIGQNVNTTLSFQGQSQEANFFVIEDKGWRICGGDGAGFAI